MKRAIIFAFASVVAAGVGDGFAGQPDEVLRRHTLYLRAAQIDTAAEPDALAVAVPRSASGRDRYVVQLDGPMTPGRRAELERSGITLGEYVPGNAYVVELDGQGLAAVADVPFVQWVGRYRDEWRLDPALIERAAASQQRGTAGTSLQIVMVLFAGQAPDAVAQRLASVGGEARHVSVYGDRAYIDGTIPAGRLTALAHWPEVLFVEPAPQGRLRNDTNEWIAQSNVSGLTPVWDQGLHGEDQMIGLIDAPVDFDHCSFYDPLVPVPGPTHRKFYAYRGTFGSHYHGTHVAGTLAGDSGTYGADDFRDGLAFAAKISYSDYFAVDLNPATFYDRLLDAHNDGARVHSNSWGEGVTSYALWSELTDRFSRDYEEDLVVFAADNSGVTKVPENAKSVLAVNKCQDTPNQGAMVSGAVTGPTWDGRRKPEIVAPGAGTQSSNDGTACSWEARSGTSMACPVVAAGGVLARQYFVDGFYPSGTATPADALVPSGALLRACLISSAADMTAEAGYPGNREGWGRLLLDNALFFAGDSRNLFVADRRNTVGLSTGDQDAYVVEVVDASEPLRITMAFTDVPATVGTAFAPVNDLDLIVSAPDGQVYRGNVFNTVAGESITGGSADAINSVEQVHRLAPVLGRYLVRVVATAVNQDVQGYALAVTGGLALAGESLVVESVESCNTHGAAGEYCTIIGPGGPDSTDNLEPRQPGVNKLRLTLSDTVDPGTVSRA